MGSPAVNLKCGVILRKGGTKSRIDYKKVRLRVFGSGSRIYNGRQQPRRESIDVRSLLMEPRPMAAAGE